MLERREFLKLLTAIGADAALGPTFAFATSLPQGNYSPGRIPNEYTLWLPTEKETLEITPAVSDVRGEGLTVRVGKTTAHVRIGESLEGWQLLTIIEMNGVKTAVFEKHATHRGAIAYVTEERGTIAYIPKYIGDLSRIRPRPTNTPDGVRLERAAHYVPGPDTAGQYLLKSQEDPSYETVAALGAEYIGWTLVANEQGGPRDITLSGAGWKIS